MELFTEHGYEATSTAAIAEHAGLSEMTLFRHFKSKEALLLDDPFDPLMAELVRMRPAHESAMQALLEAIRQALTQLDTGDLGTLRIQLKVVAQTPTLNGAVQRNSEKTVCALVAALEDRGVAEDAARIAASAVIAGLGTALLNWARSECAALETVLEDALNVLGGA